MKIKIFNLKKLKIFIRNINEDKIGEYTSGCAYFTILSFIPFLILLITLMQYTSITQQTLLHIISKLVPSNMNELILEIVREVYSKSIRNNIDFYNFYSMVCRKRVISIDKRIK